MEHCKEKIAELRDDFPIDEQRLFFEGTPMEDDKTLVNSGVKNGDTLFLGPMEVYVRRLPKGKRIKLNVIKGPGAPLEYLQELVAKEEGTPVEHQRLFFEGKKLTTAIKSLRDYGIKHKDIVDLKGMIIFVECLDNDTLTLVVEPEDTILSVKTKVKQRKFYPINAINLFHDGKPLDKDKKTLEYYLIKHLDTLNMGAMVIYVVQRWDSKKYSLSGTNVTPQNTIEELKEQIEKKSGIPPREQRLTFNGKSVYNKKTLEESRIKHKSTLYLEGKQIKVKTPDGKSALLDVAPQDTVQDVKTRIFEMTGLPPEAQALTFNKIRLDDPKPLSDYKIPHGAPVDVDGMLVDVDIPAIFDYERNNNGKKPGDKAKIAILPTHTIDDVKQVIEDKTGIPKSSQRLFFMDNELDDPTKTISKMPKIRNGEELVMKPPEVTIQTPDGKSRVFQFDPEDTVDNLKEQILKKVGIPKDGQRLAFDNDDELEDDDPLTKIGPNTVLVYEPTTVDLELPGGDRTRIPVKPLMTVDDVKDLIEESTGIPKRSQRLFFLDPDQELDGKLPLSRSKIGHGSKLELKMPDVEIMLPNGKSRTFVFTPEETIKSFKKKIAKKFKLDPAGQRLLFDDVPMDDDDLVLDKIHGTRSFTLEPNEVEVELPGDSRVRLGILPSNTIDDLKDQIEKETGVPKARQRIFHLDTEKELDGDLDMNRAKLKHGSKIEMVPREFKVQTPDGDSRVFHFDRDETVADLKKRVADRVGLMPGAQRMIFNDDDLDDDLLLDDFVRRDAVLTMEQNEIEVAIGNKKVKLAILPTHTIGDIKEIVEEKTGVPRARQRCFFLDADGNELDDATPLAKTKIAHGSKIEMRSPEVEVKLPDGRSFFVVIDPDDTMETIQKKLTKKAGFKVGGALFKIKLNGLDFEDDPSVDDLLRGLSHGDVMTVDPAEVEIAVPELGKVKLTILPTTTIADVKKVIEEKLPTFKSSRQRMFFMDSEEELDDKTPFVKLKFDKGFDFKIESFELNINHWDGSTFKLECSKDEYVDDIKESIESLKGILVDHQRLSLDGTTILDDTLTLAEQDVVHNSTLELLAMKISVEIPGGKTLTLTVEVEDTIQRIKEMVFETHKFDVDDQCILFDGQDELADNSSLEENGIDHEDVLTMEMYSLSAMHWCGDTFAIEGIRKESKLNDIKKIVLNSRKIPKDQQRYLYGGATLDERKSLISQGVKHKSVLIMEEARVIEVQLPKRKKISLVVFPTTTVAEMKQVIEEKVPKMKEKKQRIFFLDGLDELSDDTPFEKLKIDVGAALEVRPYELAIKRWDGSKFKLGPSEDDYPDDVKDQIEALKDIPIDQQRLTYKGKLLDDELTLRENKVKHHGTLVLEPMRIHIVEEDGTRHKLIVELEFTGAKIREILAETIKSPLGDDKVLLVGAEEIEAETTLDDLLVDHDDEIDLVTFEVIVMDWYGSMFPVREVGPTGTVDDIKKHIVKMKQIPISQISLTHQGRPLDDSSTLAAQNVHHKSAMVMMPPEGVDLSLPDGGRVSVGLLSTRSFRDVAFEEILPVEPDWKKRIFFFDEGLGEDGGYLLITFIHYSGKEFQFDDVRWNETGASLKERLFREKKIPKHQQRLLFGGKVLQDDKTIRKQRIKNKSIITMESVKKNRIAVPSLDKMGLDHISAHIAKPFKLFIKHWNGKKYKMTADPTDYIDDLKDRIEEQCNVPSEQQRLLFQNRPVEETLTLEDNGIGEKSLVALEPMTMYVKLPEGGQIGFTVELGDSVQQIKLLLFEKTNIPIHVQCLLLGGVELADAKTLGDYDIDHEDTINLEVFKISVMEWTGKLFSILNVLPMDTPVALKGRIEKQEGIHVDRQLLKFDGGVVDETKSLKEQGIRHRTVLVMEDAKSTGIDLDAQEKFKPELFPLGQPGATAGGSSNTLTLKVIHWNGNALPISVSPTDYIADVKDQIQKLHGIPTDQQRLACDGIVTSDDLTLEEQGIDEDANLTLEATQIHLIVNTKRITFQVDLQDSIASIKEKILEKMGIPINDQSILFGAEELENDQTLEDYAIEHDDELLVETFLINVLHWSGSDYALTGASVDSTIESLKPQIKELTSVAIVHQRFTYEGKPVQDDQTFKEQGIKHKGFLVMEELQENGEISVKEKVKLSFVGSANNSIQEFDEPLMEDPSESMVDDNVDFISPGTNDKKFKEMNEGIIAGTIEAPEIAQEKEEGNAVIEFFVSPRRQSRIDKQSEGLANASAKIEAPELASAVKEGGAEVDLDVDKKAFEEEKGSTVMDYFVSPRRHAKIVKATKAAETIGSPAISTENNKDVPAAQMSVEADTEAKVGLVQDSIGTSTSVQSSPGLDSSTPVEASTHVKKPAPMKKKKKVKEGASTDSAVLSNGGEGDDAPATVPKKKKVLKKKKPSATEDSSGASLPAAASEGAPAKKKKAVQGKQSSVSTKAIPKVKKNKSMDDDAEEQEESASAKKKALIKKTKQVVSAVKKVPKTKKVVKKKQAT